MKKHDMNAELLTVMDKHRKYLHKIPELGFEEYKTQEYIIKELEETKPDELRKIAKTGVIAFYKSNKDIAETVAFRSDIDGLPIQEDTGLGYQSIHEGYMHACGHDAHMSMLLGLAKYIENNRADIDKDILLIFQPAEEGPGGALPIVEENVLEEFNVKSIYGIHVYPDVEEGKIAIKEGPTMAMTGEFDIKVGGKGAHGALPHKGVDAILISARIIQDLQSIISRRVSPVEPGVVTVGKMYGGDRRNVIADEVILEGTFRAFSDETYNKIKTSIISILRGLEIANDVKIDIEFRDMYPFVDNDSELVKKLRELMPESWVDIEPQMTAEDFSYYQRRVPGVFMLLGTRNEKDGLVLPLHNSRFNFNTEVLGLGLESYIKIVQN